MGAAPRFDSYGRLAGARADPAGRARAAAHRRRRSRCPASSATCCRCRSSCWPRPAFLAASADEPVERNFVRKHALAYQARTRLRPRDGGAARVRQCRRRLRLQRQPSGRERPLGRRGRTRRDLHAPQGLRLRPQRPAGAAGRAAAERARERRPRLPEPRLGRARRHHGRSLFRHARRHQPRGAARHAAARRRRSISATRPAGDGTVRTLSEQVALETRTRMLNPKWYEGMLKHGYEGVRQIEAHVTNTMGWSATTGEVAPWVYQQLTETFMLDPEMRERLAALNPTASAKVANRLLEAHERNYWTPDEAMLDGAAPAPARSWKTGSKASMRSGRMNIADQMPRRAEPAVPRRRRGQRPGPARPDAQDRHRQGVRGLRQGRHRQEHDLVEPVGRVLQARQARAADRLRSQARLDLHADQAAGADRDRRAGVGELPRRGTARRGLRLSRATTA